MISLAVAAAGWVGVSSPGDYAAVQFPPLPRHDPSEATSKQLRTLSETVRKRLDKIEQKQSEIEHFQAQLLRSFNTQTEQTMSLVQQVNALLKER